MIFQRSAASNSLRPERVVLLIVGCVLCASGGFHVLVWLWEGGTLSGPISWRKPILFGFSAGVTVISLGWVIGKMERSSRDVLLISFFGVAMLAEVALITLQQWRGVASHFNRATPWDAAVLNTIEGLILLATLVIADLTWRSFGSLAASPDTALAIRGGMTLLFASCLLGGAMTIYGNARVAQGLPPDVYPPSGAMKFPHGVPMHAIQYLPILGWALRRLDVEQRARYRAIRWALCSVIGFTVFSALQTFTGRARFELWWPSGLVLMFAAGMLAFPSCLAVSHAARKLLAVR